MEETEVEKMTDEEQKIIFSKNLRKYIALNQKQQTEVSKDIGVNLTTLNMWCRGKSMPGPGKLGTLARYFGIGVSELINESKADSTDEEYQNAVKIISENDERFKKIVIGYMNQPAKNRKLICDFFETFVFKE
jgi:transcriptional regulator with XRE-family HTH domain